MSDEMNTSALPRMASEMGHRWKKDLLPFIEHSDYGTGLVLAVLIQISRSILDDMPQAARARFVQAVATPGIEVDMATEAPLQ